MDGGSVTVWFKAITHDYERSVDRAKAKTQTFKAETEAAGLGGSRAMLGLATKASLVATGLVVAGQAAIKLNKWIGDLDRNAKSAGTSLTGAAGAANSFSNTITSTLDRELNYYGKLLGYDRERIQNLKAINELREEGLKWAERELIVLRDGSQIAFKGTGEDRNFRNGGAGYTTPPPDRQFTGALNKNLEQRIAYARTTAAKADDVAAVKAGIAYLNKIAKDPRIKGDARTNLYVQLAQLQDELASLTEKQVVEKKKQKEAVKKETAALQFAQINAASTVGGLGAGPYLSSPVFQYAQQFGFKARPIDYLKDLRTQVGQAAGFNRNLTKIGKAGASQNLVGELAGMGQQGQDIAAALAKRPGLVKQYSQLADKRAAIAEKLQVQSMRVVAASVVVQGSKIVGVDRNGNNQLEKGERFTVMNGGTVRRGGDRMGGV